MDVARSKPGWAGRRDGVFDRIIELDDSIDIILTPKTVLDSLMLKFRDEFLVGN